MSLDQLRKRIDELDAQLLQLLNERTCVAVAVGQIKHKSGQEIYSPQREEAVLKRLLTRNAGPLTEVSLRAIWREIMSAALAVEKHLVIAYVGPVGSGAHLASQNKFGSSLQYNPMPTMAAVFDAVAMCRADYGMVPVEHLSNNVRSHVCDLLADSTLKVCAEVWQPTRHLVIGRHGAPPTGKDKTAIMFMLTDRVGSLEESLAAFRKNKVNLLTIELRHLGGEGGPDYFFVELTGHAEDRPVSQAIAELERISKSVKVLGSYAQQNG